jgi:8-oxo-dGTP pyrophosphatase MutT (NUDIX family)
MTQKEDIQKLIVRYNRRLQKLKEQQAITGFNVSPQTLMEIEDIELEIEKLQSELVTLEKDDFTKPYSKNQSTEIVTGFSWSEVRQVVRLAFEYVVSRQKPEGVWLRSDLFPTSRTLFGLLISGIYLPNSTVERSASWISEHLTDSNEQPDATAMGILVLSEASRFGIQVNIEKAVEIILDMQNPDGSWSGRFELDRYSATATAYSLQALRVYNAKHNQDDLCLKACYRGAQYLQRYFRSLDISKCQYSDFVNPIEALILPHYEAWGVIDTGPVARAVEYFANQRDRFKKFGNTKAVAGILTLMLTQWRDFNEDILGELLSWLVDVRNPDNGWSEHAGEPSEPHQTVMITLPVRQSERLGDHYIPIDLSDNWSLPIEPHILKEHSIGAVIFRRLIDEPEIILLRRANGTWVLPKGHIEPNEEIEAALRREITEETGITNVKIHQKLGDFRYLFRPNGDVVDKVVTYHLVECQDFNIQLTTDVDHLAARWVPIDDVQLMPVYYDDARQAIERARQLLK